MTSLCPGTLFQAPGLNQKSTPSDPAATPADIDRKLKRLPFNGHDWPKDSPVAKVYDIRNSSTSLVLLNKRRKKKSQLRGLTERNGEISTPNPERHIPEEASVNWGHHRKCLNSSSEPFRPKLNLDLGWVNNQQRPPVKFDSGSHVNHKRHTSCRVGTEGRGGAVGGWRGPRSRPATSMSSHYGVESELRTLTPMLNDPDLSPGERKYLYSIARIYSTSQMKALKQDQYHQLLFKELNKGYHSPREYERYLTYLNTPRKTQYGKLDDHEEQLRSRSAPPPTDKEDNHRGGESQRAHMAKGRTAPYSSRSWAPSQMSGTSRNTSASGSARRTKGSSTGSRKKAPPKRQQSPPPSSERTTKASEAPTTVAPSAISTDDEDGAVHTRKEESELPEENLVCIRESDEGSVSKSGVNSDAATVASTRRPSDTTAASEKTATPGQQDALSPRQQDADGVSPRKGDDGITPRVGGDGPTPRKGEEEAFSPRKTDTLDGRQSDERESNAGPAASNPQPPASSTTTSQNFLALIVSDAEKDDTTVGTKTLEASSTGEGPEGEGPEGEEERGDGHSSARSAIPRDFSDNQLASGYSPRLHKEGRTRPLSRAGRPGTVRERGDRENSDDDYDDTDDETEKMATMDPPKEESDTRKDEDEDLQKKDPPKEDPPKQEAAQTSLLAPEQPATDSARTDDSKTEERGGETEEAGGAVVNFNNSDKRRAESPEEGRDERADDTHDTRDRAQQRSHVIPVTRAGEGQGQSGGDAVMDLAAEGKNRDVEKIEY